MRGDDFVKALLARRAYLDAGEHGLNGMLAVAFVYRNRMNAGWWGGSWIEVLKNHHMQSAYVSQNETELPDPRNYAFQCLLQEVDGIFAGTREDDVSVPKDSVLAVKPKPLYFAELNKIDRDWFLENISLNHEHKRMAQIGSLTLFT